MTLFPDVFSKPGRHTVEHMADVVAECLTNWGFKNKVMSIICNKSLYKNEMVNSLAIHEWKMFSRCLGHVRFYSHNPGASG
jgi:hypothetical protein